MIGEVVVGLGGEDTWGAVVGAVGRRGMGVAVVEVTVAVRVALETVILVKVHHGPLGIE